MENCLKCGITVKPPALILIYKNEASFRKKTMPLRHFKQDSNCNFVALEIKKRHHIALPQLRIEKLLRILQEMMAGKPKAEALRLVEEEQNKKQNGNLNKLSTLELDLQKEEMEIVFSKNQVKPGDANYEYDTQVTFEPKETSVWDKEDDDDFWN